MKFISLFAGIGGFDLALIRQGHKCVWANEWDKYAAQIYDKNFNQNPQSLSEVKQDQKRWNRTLNQDGSDSLLFGHSQSTGNRIDTRDIRTIPTDEIPDHDLLVGGFPCQAFSITGKRRGFDDTRGTLFFEIARILRAKKPRLFILENVKGLLSHDNGNTFKTIISTLDELGYDIQWQVLNSKNFGVPQNRERVFIIGNLRGTSRPQVFPIREDETVGDKTRTENGETIPCLESTMYKGVSSERFYGISPQLDYIGGIEGNRKKWLDDGKNNSRNFSQGQRVYSTKGISSTLAGNAGGLGGKTGLCATPKIRRLTPIECERLQGFPDNWTAVVSDTQRYKMCGNAVTVNVVEWIVKQLSITTPPKTK